MAEATDASTCPPGGWKRALDVDLSQAFSSKKSRTVSMCSAKDGQEMDKSAASPICRLSKLLLELVELMGIEPMTS